MCGIAGVRSERGGAHQAVAAMIGALHHRGPDAAGWYHSGPFTGGMRRLSINDLVQGGQPLFNRDRTVALLYNGEIYNSPELRRQLEAGGTRFATGSDGEVICHLYDVEGEAAFERLDGMFAAALWSEHEQKLILARDLAGEKPLYYTQPDPGTLIFASELKALRRVPGLALSLNRQGLWDMPTFLWIPEPDTVFQDVHALPPGHLLVADREGVRLKPYANRFDPGPVPEDEPGLVAMVRSVVEAAVYSRLLSDVPVASFLSSGLDSSIVATLAAGALGTLATFSVGFEDLADPYHGRADESAAAQDHARRLGADHHTVRVTSHSFRGLLGDFCRFGDQPMAVSSGLGVLAVARAAAERGFKVLLSGDGADELFGGYSWYAHLADPPLPGVPTPPGLPPVSFQTVGLPLAERRARLAGYPPALRAWAWHYYASETDKAALFAPDFAEGLSSSLRHFGRDGCEMGGAPEDFIAHDRRFYLPFEMLTKLDRMTMAASVESRAPFVAAPVLALAGRLDYRRLVRDGTLKWALRQAFADLLPAGIVSRPKHGFNVPIDHWLRGEWADLVDRTFAGDSALARHGIVGAGADGAARQMLMDRQRLNGHTIFSLIMMNLWLEQEP